MAWVRISSEPEFFVLVNFSAIGKITAHLRRSCLYFILTRKLKETYSLQIHIEKSRSKMSLRFDYKMFLNVLLYALKKTFEGQWPEYNWSKYSGAMERPIKVNRHKGGGVDIYFWREAWVQILSEPEFFSVFFSAVGKIAAHLRGSCLFLILHRQLQRNQFFYKYTV